MTIAMLIIDLQKCFVSEYPDARSVESATEVINYVAGIVRKAGHTVIHVQDVADAEYYSEEELGFIDEITVESADLLIKKTHGNAFWKTELEETLKSLGVDLLIISGQAAEHCVVFTYNGARERGFRPVILQRGVASSRPGRVEAIEQDRNVISYSVIEALAGG